MDNKSNTDQKKTKILFSDDIDTPYPYCIVPKLQYQALIDQIERNKDIAEGGPRSLLSVTTWDGRELFQLRSFRE